MFPVGRGRPRLLLAGFAALAYVIVPAGPALAATASVVPVSFNVQALFLRAAPGEVNDVSVTQEALGSYTLVDRGSPIEAGAGCIFADPQRVVCIASELVVLTADGDDRIMLSLIKDPDFVSRMGTSGSAFVQAGAGNDTVQGTLAGPQGAHPGGSDFTARGAFRGTYAILGEEGDDVIVGSADHDILDGGSGNDLLSGLEGDDVVAGGRDDDVVAGGPGADFLLGSDLEAFEFGRGQPPDEDALRGEQGPDLVAGGPGSDRLIGGGGRDALLYSRSLGLGRRPPAKLSVSFDGRANDGPRGERDNAERPDLESAISVGSGTFALSGAVVLRGGTYALAGGRSTRATIVVLSRRGTRAAQLGTFAGSSFTVSPGGLRGPVTEVRPEGGDFRSCRAGSRGSEARASRQDLPRRTIRRLRSNAKGRFRTRGRHSAATVRGTVWLTADRCDGTLTKVTRGSVRVRDLRRKRTVIVRAGESYLARARG